eukprot:SM000047S16892  [mRNA]  locus=s47:503770:507145:- [translate_table: standard]
MTYVFHNLRVPFNAIVLGLGHMRDAGALTEEEAIEKMDLVQMMLDCADTMTSVLDDVTDMGQWEDGCMELHADVFDLLAVVRFLASGLEDLLDQKAITFELDVAPNVQALLMTHLVVADKHRVIQTLGNFLSNAVKFTAANGRVVLCLSLDGPPLARSAGAMARVTLAVQDSGVGIGPADQARLFEPYTLVGSGWVQKAGVSGLGLSMAKKFVEAAGGAIGVTSELGAGSTFYFTLPLPLIDHGVEEGGAGGAWEEGGGLVGRGEEGGGGGHCRSCAGSLRRLQAGGLAAGDPSPRSRLPSAIGVNADRRSGSATARASGRPDGGGNSGSGGGLARASSLPPESRLEAMAALRFSSASPSTRASGTVYQRSLSSAWADKSYKGGGIGGSGSGSKRRVLLVEDTEINRIILRKVLQKLNLHCDEAENGAVAVELFRSGAVYDLVLMDKEMPVMDGHEATRQIRLLGVKTPIIALTGNSLQSDRDLFFEAGADEFQTKPLSRDKLVQLLARYGVEGRKP